MSVWELYTQLIVRNWRYGRFARSLSQGCSVKIREKDVIVTAGRWSSWSIPIPQFLMLWWPAMKAGSTAMTQKPRDRIPSGSMLALPDPRRPNRANPPTNLWWPFFLLHRHVLHALCSPWTDKEYFVEFLREFRKRSRRKRPAFFKSGQWHFQQDDAPVHNSILVTDYLTKMGIKTVQNLLPVTFGYSLSSRKNVEAVVMRQLRRWKRTSMGPCRSFWNGTTSALQLEEITLKVTRVSCVYYQ